MDEPLSTTDTTYPFPLSPSSFIPSFFLFPLKRLVDLLDSKRKDMLSALDILRMEMIGSFAFTFLTNDNRV